MEGIFSVGLTERGLEKCDQEFHGSTPLEDDK